MNNVCMFTGHRILRHTKQLDDALDRALSRLYDRGFFIFISGGAMGFDLIAARAVLRLKERFPDVKLFMMLPHKNQSERFPSDQKKEYSEILKLCDKTQYLSEHYYEGCMHDRNRNMAQSADICLCYLLSSKGGTAYTAAYAASRGLEIINIAEDLGSENYV